MKAPTPLGQQIHEPMKSPARKREPRMTTIHVQQIGNSALLPQKEFERLVELARRSEEIALNLHQDDFVVPTETNRRTFTYGMMIAVQSFG